MEAAITAALLASCVMPAEMRPVRCLPNANSSVAPSSSQGSTCRNVCAGVLINKNAPASPPMTLVITSGIMTRRVMFSFSRYAPPLAVVPTHSASVFVAFAGIAGTPVNSSAGVFHGPRFDKDGKLLRPAHVTVLHNGVLVQDNVELTGPTVNGPPYKSHAEKLPLGLQDHGNPVRYRNVWIRELKSTE